ncbi:MAG: hypothetical protein U0835_04215 [Isosphaeraceae bacterium]
MSNRRRSCLAVAPVLLGAAYLGLAGPSAARAQTPQPSVPELQQRSGLIRRFVPITPHLPPDLRRDDWYDTRWGDAPNLRKHPNFYKNGGLYGLPWPVDHTRSYYPYFYGAPGPSTIRPESTPPKQFWRVASALVKPFKPVGYYYDQGSHVPVYDLDPIVPGPGPMIWPFFPKITAVGG